MGVTAARGTALKGRGSRTVENPRPNGSRCVAVRPLQHGLLSLPDSWQTGFCICCSRPGSHPCHPHPGPFLRCRPALSTRSVAARDRGRFSVVLTVSAAAIQSVPTEPKPAPKPPGPCWSCLCWDVYTCSGWSASRPGPVPCPMLPRAPGVRTVRHHIT